MRKSHLKNKQMIDTSWHSGKKGMEKNRQGRVGRSDSFGEQNALCGFSENNDSPNGAL